MRKPAILVTGAGGEIGHALLTRLGASRTAIVALDVHPLDAGFVPPLTRIVTASVTDTNALDRILAEFEVDLVFHLAALLSTRAEFTPLSAHHVNVEGTLNLLEFAQRQGESHGRSVVFVYPSSIAVYGMSSLEAKMRAGRVREEECAHPKTMYGCNKLYCEELGRYYARHYKQLSAGTAPRVDFRAVRFPGLISGTTVPSGGTSDFAPEMIHAAAKGESYACFVRPDTTIPFMAMPDAIEALLALARAPSERLRHTTYNASAFNPSANQIREVVLQEFPKTSITFNVDLKRQGIVDSWPAALDDFAARADWDFRPRYDFEHAFSDYLIPTIRRRYNT